MKYDNIEVVYSSGDKPIVYTAYTSKNIAIGRPYVKTKIFRKEFIVQNIFSIGQYKWTRVKWT